MATLITRTGALAVAAAVAALAAAGAPPAAFGAAGVSMHGTVMAAGKPLGGAEVTLFAGSREGVSELGQARTDTSGSFGISYVKPAAGVLYVQAAPTGTSRLRLQSVVGVGSGGGVPPQTLTTVTIDELTTVATAYALAQFSGPNGIAGPSPGLENAAATAFSLADPVSGKAGAVVTDQDNGGKNQTLATLGTLANLVSLCRAGQSPQCGELLRLTVPPGGTVPGKTVQADLNLARNPSLSPAGLFALARTASVYQPALTAPPTAWILALLYTVPLSPGTGWTNGGLNHPQGVAVDQKGNVWIANNYGPKSAPGQGNVVVYPGGDPSKALTISGSSLNHPFAIQIDGYGRAWVTNAGLGGARLVNTRAAILVGKFGGSITVIGPDFKPVAFSPIQSSSFKWQLGLAIDSKNNAWVTSYFSSAVTEIRSSGAVAGVYHLPKTVLPWSEAIDGSDRVLGGRLRHAPRMAALRRRHHRVSAGVIHRHHPVPQAGVPERRIPAFHVDSGRPVRQHLAEQQLVQAQPADWRRRNRGDRRRCYAGMQPADSRARSALLVDRHRLRAADRDAPGGRPACFFCSPDRRRGQCQPAGRDAGLGVGREHRRVRRAGGRRCAVLPPALCQVVTCLP